MIEEEDLKRFAQQDSLKILRERDAALIEKGRRMERKRCAGMASDLADLMRAANRKKFAAELDMLARDMIDYREVINSKG